MRWILSACLLVVCLLYTSMAQVAESAPATKESPDAATDDREVPQQRSDLTPYELQRWLNHPSAITTSQWVQVVRSMGIPYQRNSFRDQLLSLEPFPAEVFIRLLTHSELAVRLGALELLEEHNASDFDYDPWAPATSSENIIALDQWEQWLHSDQGDTPNETIYSGFSREEVYALIQDVLSKNSPQRSARATRLLSSGDLGVADNIKSYINRNDQLSLPDRRTLDEIYFRILIPPSAFIDESTLAHRLVFGDMDTRAHCYQKLAIAGKAARLVFETGLSDPNPMVREAAAEALIQTCGKDAIETISTHLDTEADDDVVYAILRTLSMIKSSDALNLLVSYFKHDKEDIVLISIQSVAKMKSRRSDQALGECLSDPRWRVRAAALVAVEETKSTKLSTQVQACVTDEDEFVRYAAVKTLPAIMKKKACTKLLATLFVTEPSLRIPITEAFVKLDVTIPESLHQVILDEPSEALLSITELLTKDVENNIDILIKLSKQKNTDVACVALRGLAQEAESDEWVIDAMVVALGSTEIERKRAVLDFFQPDPDLTYQQTWSSEGVIANIPVGGFNTEGQDGKAADPAISDLFDAFLSEEPEPSVITANAQPHDSTPSIDSLFEAFDIDDEALVIQETERTSTNRITAGKVSDLIEAIKTCTKDDHADIAQYATIALLSLTPKDTIQQLETNYLKHLSPKQQKKIANMLEYRKSEEQLLILQQLLLVPDKDVRETTTSALLSRDDDTQGLRLVLSALDQTDTPLHPTDVYPYYFTRSMGKNRQTAKRWAQTTLLSTNSPPEAACVFALASLGAYGRKTNVDIVTPFLTNTNEYMRAAAWYALASLDPDTFFDTATNALTDTKEVVRYSIIATCNPYAERILEYRGNKQSRFSGQGYRIEKRPGKHKSTAIQMLNQLKNDPAPRVQLAASLGLLACREDVAPAAIHNQLSRIPEDQQTTAIAQIVDTFIKVAGRLDSSFAGLLPVLKKSHDNTYDIKRLEEAFAKKHKQDQFTHLARSNRPEDIPTSNPPSVYASEAAQQTQPIPTAATLNIVFFHTPACEECEIVEQWLTAWSNEFPHITLDRISILTSQGEQLQTAYLRQANKDLAQAGITPFLVTAAGCLNRQQLEEPSRLHDMLLNAQFISDTNWIIQITTEPDITTSVPEPPAPQQVTSNQDTPSKNMILLPVITVSSILLLLAILNSWRRNRSD